MKHFIKLTTSDSKTPFWVDPEEIVAMYEHNNFTVIHYRAHTGQSWCVLETPMQIMKKIKEEEWLDDSGGARNLASSKDQTT